MFIILPVCYSSHSVAVNTDQIVTIEPGDCRDHSHLHFGRARMPVKVDMPIAKLVSLLNSGDPETARRCKVRRNK